MYSWTTYPLTTLLEDVFNVEKTKKAQEKEPSALNLELTAALERSLNFAHTGNTRVLIKSVMEPLWMSLGILTDGFPALNPDMVHLESDGTVIVSSINWPRRSSDNTPISVASRAIEFSFGKGFSLVCLSPSL